MSSDLSMFRCLSISPNFSHADFTASALLQAIRGSSLQLHGLRLASAANSTREKSVIRRKMMAYDEGLAQRISEVLEDMAKVVEKKMFGGVCYLVDGNMACGVIKEFLIVRVGPDRYEEALSNPHTKLFDFTGRPMKGWVMVDEEGYGDDDDLSEWVWQGVEFAKSLPPK